ncbi:MAG: hypothetical protein U1E62_21530 [Alsobacter sp.]
MNERVCIQLAPPDDAYVISTCQPGKGERTCRYLCGSATGWSCEKLTELREHIDRRMALGSMNATGDNCDGRGSQ